MLYNSLLFVHILAAAVWLGGGVMLAFLVQRATRVSLPALAGVAGAASATGALLGASGGIAFVAGIGLVLASDGQWAFDQVFVSIGVLVFLIVSGLGARVVAPACEELATAAEAGDTAAVAPAQARLVRFALINVALLTVAIAAMSFKWGA